MRFFTMMIL